MRKKKELSMCWREMVVYGINVYFIYRYIYTVHVLVSSIYI